MPATTEERQAAFSGCVVGWYEAGNWVQNAEYTISRHDIKINFFDRKGRTAQRFIAFFPSLSGRQDSPRPEDLEPMDLQGGLFRAETIVAVDRTWLVISRPGPDYRSLENSWLA